MLTCLKMPGTRPPVIKTSWRIGLFICRRRSAAAKRFSIARFTKIVVSTFVWQCSQLRLSVARALTRADWMAR
jgi:hypothetical protein